MIALDLGAADESLKKETLRELMPIIRDTDYSRPPAFTTSLLHRHLRNRLGCDPYAGVKRQYNALALGLLPELRGRMRASEDPLWMAVRLAIAGNIIDFGVARSFDLDATLDRALTGDLFVDEYPLLGKRIDEASTVLYLCDNAGEIVFDRLLIETLQSLGKSVTAVVKGGAVINDATAADAEEIALSDFCTVMDNGSDDVGTLMESCSKSFRQAFHEADLVISKGQANFETLHDQDGPVFFLFQAKCDVLAEALGAPKGAMFLCRGGALHP